MYGCSSQDAVKALGTTGKPPVADYKGNCAFEMDTWRARRLCSMSSLDSKTTCN